MHPNLSVVDVVSRLNEERIRNAEKERLTRDAIPARPVGNIVLTMARQLFRRPANTGMEQSAGQVPITRRKTVRVAG